MFHSYFNIICQEEEKGVLLKKNVEYFSSNLGHTIMILGFWTGMSANSTSSDQSAGSTLFAVFSEFYHKVTTSNFIVI